MSEAAVTLTISDGEVTVAASDVHPIACDDTCRLVGDLVLRLYRELNRTEEDA